MAKVTKKMNISEILQDYPEVAEVFGKNGMNCPSCIAARFETLESGARVHGIDPDELVADINAFIS